jgi:hypothetical protein
MAYAHNNQHCPIPASNQDNIYIGRDCCLFNKHSFDESLTIGKLSRSEFNHVIDTIHEKVNNFKNYWKIIICSIFFILLSIAIFVICLVKYSGDDSSDKDYSYYGYSEPKKEANGWGIAFGVIFYIVGLAGSVLCMIWRMIVYNTKC